MSRTRSGKARRRESENVCGCGGGDSGGVEGRVMGWVDVIVSVRRMVAAAGGECGGGMVVVAVAVIVAERDMPLAE